jgi:signal peptidase I
MHAFFKILAIGILLGLSLKFFVIESFTVPTDSMSPTLPVGSRIWLLKLPFSPQNDDVIGFERAGENFIKRVVGTPSEWVYTEGGQWRLFKNISTSEPKWLIPKRGDKLELTAENFKLYKSLIESEGHKAGLLLGKIYIDGQEANHYTFQQNYYFVQGDNAAGSIDSRHFGLISEKAIIGRLMR